MGLFQRGEGKLYLRLCDLNKEYLNLCSTQFRYLEVVLRRMSTGQILFSPHFAALIANPDYQQTFSPDQYTDNRGKIFGFICFIIIKQ